MIGPGTGLAPFRGFLQERADRKAKGASLGPAMLFFGCRHPEQDFLYADELKAFAADGITELHTAFSRADGPKTYVQHLVAAQKDQVWSLIEQGAIIYVCGDGGKMEPDVKAALVSIYRERTGADADAGAALDRRSRHQEPLRAGCLGGGITVLTLSSLRTQGPSSRVLSIGCESPSALWDTGSPDQAAADDSRAWRLRRDDEQADRARTPT